MVLNRNKTPPERLHLALALDPQERRKEKLAGDSNVSCLPTSMHKPIEQKLHEPETDSGCAQETSGVTSFKQEGAFRMPSQSMLRERQDDASGLLETTVSQTREHEKYALTHRRGPLNTDLTNVGFGIEKGPTQTQSATMQSFADSYKNGSSTNSLEQNNSGCPPSVQKGMLASIQTNFSLNQSSSNSGSSQPVCLAANVALARGVNEVHSLGSGTTMLMGASAEYQEKERILKFQSTKPDNCQEKNGVCDISRKQPVPPHLPEEGERVSASSTAETVTMPVQATPTLGIPISTAAGAATGGTNMSFSESKVTELSTRVEGPMPNATTEEIAEEQGVERENVEEGEDRLIATENSVQLPRKLEYTTIEKWTLDQKKKKQLEEQSWAQKQRKTEERIAVRFHQLKVVCQGLRVYII